MKHDDSILSAPRPGNIRHVLDVAFPLVLATSGHAIRIFADRVMLSRYSSEALAASLPAGLTGFALMCLFIGTAGYCGTFVSQYVGAERRREAGLAVWQGIYVSLLGALFMLAISTQAEALFRWMAHPPQVQVQQVRYFRVLAYFAAPSMVLSTLNGFWSGRGRTVVVMRIELFCAAANVALNALLIFGRWGLPAMGIAGAAYATGLSSLFGAAIAFVAFLRPANRVQFNTWPARTFDMRRFGQLIRFGLPNGIQFSFELLAFNLFVIFMGRLGVVELAAAGIVFGLNALAFLPIIGLGMAGSIFVGQGIGAGRTGVARRGVRSACIIALIYNAIMGGLFVFLPGLPLSLFAGEHVSAETLDMARICLRFVAGYLLFDAIAIVFNHAIKGAGDTRFALLAGFVLSWGTLVLPTYLALRLGASRWLMWSILVVHVALAAAVYLLRYRSGRWESMQVIEAPPPIAGEIDLHAERRG